MIVLSSPSVRETAVIDRREAADGIVVLGLSAPGLAACVRPGQFAMVVPPGGERAATALGIYEADGDRISLMLVVVGPRTRELARVRVGERLTLLAPLGNGFDIDALGDDVGVVAGGVGIASLLLPVRALRERGARVSLYYGARTANALVDAASFEAHGARVRFATDDGSLGHRGFVTDVLDREGSAHTAYAACGPSPMLRAVGRVAAKHGVRAQLSLEETFACGVGACWGCVVRIDPKSAQAPPFPAGADYVNARICKEGPVFWSHELAW